MTNEIHEMKPNPEASQKNGEGGPNGATIKIPGAGPGEPTAPAGVPKCFRRLKPDEVVSRGDFVANDQRGLEPWEGPGGFYASTFVKPIYRRDERGSPATRKPK